ncbi:Thiol-disulfide isomerase or thioredoxin [Nonlabens sp. Hel1_33_55]|uniref:TlpA family protein disulfide reductase n=1 Tax=Nonlabens sp. Hel1_33_55 TaxID=1336802 RepID=UPI000875E170|nr:TlpA family protein disulfide reductase [Nonlabens sp. Hel1_33_55]SCY37660.1 Thiol-disulfide isomerase or thioredoxin [Nonlabens sp. Hel1_33_55]
MKKNIFILLVAFAILLSSCKEGSQKIEQENVLPVLSEVNVLDLQKSIDSVIVRKSMAPLTNIENIEGFSTPENIDSFRILKTRLVYINTDENVEAYILSGFKGEKQILIIDTDIDMDFTDESVREFDGSFGKQVKNNYELTKRLPIDSIKIGDKTTYFQAYPYFGYFDQIKDSIEERYKVVINYNEKYSSSFSNDDKNYTIHINHKAMFGTTFRIYGGEGGSENFTEMPYKLKDTVLIENLDFSIDSVDFKKEMLYISHTNLSSKKTLNGARVGGYIKSRFDLIGKNPGTSIEDLTEENEYLLIGFWGTWCAPCIELLPDIKEVNTKYSDLNVLSVACEQDIEKVKSHISEYGMDWNNAFIDTKPKSKSNSPILNELKIDGYPTFILTDSKGKILSRGIGKSALDKIDNLLSQD